jgi:hypothetical protein
MVELKAIVLQQREEEEEERGCEPCQSIGAEEDELVGPQATEQNGSTLHPPIELSRLPPQQPHQHPEVDV